MSALKRKSHLSLSTGIMVIAVSTSQNMKKHRSPLEVMFAPSGRWFGMFANLGERQINSCFVRCPPVTVKMLSHMSAKKALAATGKR